MTVKEVVSKTGTRNDLKKQLNKLDRFTRRGAEKLTKNAHGVNIMEWEKKEKAILLRSVHNVQNREYKALASRDQMSRGRSDGFSTEQMGSRRLKELKPTKDRTETVRSRTEFEKFVAGMEKKLSGKEAIADEINYRENFYKAIDNKLGSRGENLKKILDQIDIETIIDIYYIDSEGNIDFVYDEIDITMKLEILEDLWGSVLDGSYNGNIVDYEEFDS